MHVLARRRKNNPIFVGESGVGKTALAEGLAQRIHAGKVPDDLRDAEIYALDLGALLAGTKYRGDFEARFKALVAAIQERPNPILFIDEIHTILGAGSASGSTIDASNLLKPLLQSGELRCIGSTTYQEYRHFEKDRALARRFQRIDVHEPSVDDAVKIVEGLAPRYEEHHGVSYSKPALRAAVELVRAAPHRPLPARQGHRRDGRGGRGGAAAPGPKKRQTVGVRDVEQLIARMTGTPLARASSSERVRLEHLAEDIRKVVFGQDAAVESVVRAVKRARAGLGGTERPTGCFLFMGPTGVGKTELAKQLAKTLDVPFLRFDMSEYMEKHAVARLIGAPPGYVGYDEGGQLVEKIRRQPHAVLLLDEIEKAHRDLFDILLQVMDHATLTDNHGREADFRHVILIMTSNAGARDLAKARDRLLRREEERHARGGAPVQPRVPEPPRRDRHLRAAHARGDGARGGQVRGAGAGEAEGAQGGARAHAGRARLARREGLRPRLRRAPAWRAPCRPSSRTSSRTSCCSAGSRAAARSPPTVARTGSCSASRRLRRPRRPEPSYTSRPMRSGRPAQRER